MKYNVGDVIKVIKPYYSFGHLGEIGIVEHFDQYKKNFFINFGDNNCGWWTESCVEHFSDDDSIDNLAVEISQYAKIVNDLNERLSKLIVKYNKEVRKNRKDEDNEEEEEDDI